MAEFYRTVPGVFAGGNLGGVRITGAKRGGVEKIAAGRKALGLKESDFVSEKDLTPLRKAGSTSTSRKGSAAGSTSSEQEQATPKKKKSRKTKSRKAAASKQEL